MAARGGRVRAGALRGAPAPRGDQPLRLEGRGQAADVLEAGAVDLFAAEDAGYRRLSERSERDLRPTDYEQACRMAYYLYRSNPDFKRLVNLGVQYVVGQRPTFQAEHPSVQELVEEFWAVNQGDRQLPRWVRALCLYGELTLPAFAGSSDRVRLGYLDPLVIERIVTDPQNAELFLAVRTKSTAGQPGAEFPIVRRLETGGGWYAATERVSGLPLGVFHVDVNRELGGTRGVPDFLDGFDWFDAADEVVFAAVTRARHANAYTWDVLCRNMTEAEMEAYAAKKRNEGPPAPGSYWVHNENIEPTIKAPSLGASETKVTYDMARQRVLTSAGTPEWMLVEGGDVNFATAAAMGGPTFKMWGERQAFVRDCLLQDVVDFQVWVAWTSGRLPSVPEDQLGVRVLMDPVNREDDSPRIKRAQDVGGILRDGLALNACGKEEARRVWRGEAINANVNLDDTDPRTPAEIEADEPGNDVYVRNPPARGAVLEDAVGGGSGAAADGLNPATRRPSRARAVPMG